MGSPFPAWLPGAVAALALAIAVDGALVNLGPGSFTPAAPKITFDSGPNDPVYTLGGNTVSFGERFAGQSATGGFPVTLTGAPSNPLTLVQNGNTFITGDGANPTSPVLSGTPTFNGPISFSFATPVAAVGLAGGYFDAVGSTTIEAFNAAGASLGTIVNSQLGIEFYGLFDSSGSNIAGVSFYITGPEPAGFAIDDVTFGNADVLVMSVCPSNCSDVPEKAGQVLVSAYNTTIPSITSAEACRDACKRVKCAWTYYTFYTNTAGNPTCDCHRQCCDGKFTAGLGRDIMHGAYPSCARVCRAPAK